MIKFALEFIATLFVVTFIYVIWNIHDFVHDSNLYSKSREATAFEESQIDSQIKVPGKKFKPGLYKGEVDGEDAVLYVKNDSIIKIEVKPDWSTEIQYKLIGSTMNFKILKSNAPGFFPNSGSIAVNAQKTGLISFSLKSKWVEFEDENIYGWGPAFKSAFDVFSFFPPWFKYFFYALFLLVMVLNLYRNFFR